MLFTTYLILGVLFFTSPLGIIAFQPEIRKQTNWWRILNLPYRWNWLGVFQFILLIMLEVTGMSFIALLISITN